MLFYNTKVRSNYTVCVREMCTKCVIVVRTQQGMMLINITPLI